MDVMATSGSLTAHLHAVRQSFLEQTWSREGRNGHSLERHHKTMNVSPTSETRAAVLLVARETRKDLESGGSRDQGVLGTLLATTHETPTRCKSVPLDANTSAARARVLGDRDTSMATFLNMFKKIAGVCRPVQTYQFHTRWQSVPHTLLAISGVPCKTAVRPWSCWGRTGNFSPGRQCVTPPLKGSKRGKIAVHWISNLFLTRLTLFLHSSSPFSSRSTKPCSSSFLHSL